ncbi:hypothetical protein G7Z57_07335 [Streptococcus agalactiae]|uniref:hypothetical protein n=1 Tax=Streptococcus TaxID=1301 RepID=UPI001C2456A4|nr:MULTISPECIES: hypothetical protein [Streptococcus]MBU8847283.1 hypothetical protein [Streptococcus agalactiae]MCD0102002.1 hypothetical protein [Streptococcus agalactiae]
MQKLTSKWKSLNKNGIKLSLICGLNWLIGFVAKSQFYLFSAGFLGLLTHYMPQDYRVVIIVLVEYFFVAMAIFSFCYGTWLQDFRRIKLSLKLFIILLVFQAEAYYAIHHAISEQMVNNLCMFWIMSAVFVGLVNILLPRLFRYYVLKNIIDKKYLGIRKLTDDLPPEINFFTDAEEADADKRMRQINQNVIKQPYQDVVELSFLNRKATTAINYKTDLITKEVERFFEDVDTIYYPAFRVYPFGIEEDFSHRLIQLKLSRRNAFTKRFTRSLL